jgi:predicted Zn-dependent peptidase
MNFEVFELENGIRCIFQERRTEIVHVGLMINAGARDEEKEKEGLAHFIEHALFKGTTKRKSYHILNRLEEVGAELNAYTTKEETCVYASCLEQDVARSLDLIKDIVFNSTFPEKELEKEKSVIIEEIQSYQDSPFELIFDEFEARLFKDHSLGNNILGTKQTLKNMSRQDIIDFQKEHYFTNQMVISIVGGITEKKIKKLILKLFGDIPARYGEVARVEPNTVPIFDKRKNLDTNQAHIIIGNRAYPAMHPNRRTLVLLNNILGGPTMNNRLSLSLREKKGLAYHTESHYTSYTDSGSISIYVGADVKNIQRSIQLVDKELNLLRTKKLGERQVNSAKKQIKGQIALAQESGSNVMLGLGKSLLLYNKVDTLKDVFSYIDAITSERIIETANELFDPNLNSKLIYY